MSEGPPGDFWEPDGVGTGGNTVSTGGSTGGSFLTGGVAPTGGNTTGSGGKATGGTLSTGGKGGSTATGGKGGSTGMTGTGGRGGASATGGRGGASGTGGAKSTGTGGRGGGGSGGRGGASASGGKGGSGGGAAVAFSQVGSIIAARCSMCHAATMPVLQNNAALRNTLTTFKVPECGNDSLVTPSDPANSALLQLVSKQCGTTFMPPTCTTAPCIPAADVTTITNWINAGAPP